MVKFAYTRYLYLEDEVRYSLMMSLLERNKEESLFWLYELYFSGFDVFGYLFNLYELLYITKKSILNEMEELHNEWLIDKNKHHIPGTFIINMINYKYSIAKFVKKMYKIKCKDVKKNEKYSNKLIHMKPEEYEKYTTKLYPEKAYKTLAFECKYFIRKNFNTLCEQPITYDIKMYTNNWLYYASAASIWKDRITLYNGRVDDEKKEVIFDNIEDKEKFDDEYDLEPDEQSLETQQKSLGREDDKQFSVNDLIKNYGGFIEHVEEKSS